MREEAGKGDRQESLRRLQAIESFATLDIEDSVAALALAIVQGHGIPEEYPEDALHVAIAAVNGIDAVVTWNFTHLNNPFTRASIRRIVENAGYQCPEICSPDELLEAMP